MNLPEPKQILFISQRLAFLDAIISPEWEYRYYSFNHSWDLNQQMASMRDGSGNEYFILFENNNCGIKVYNKQQNEECQKFITEQRETDNHFIRNFLNEPAFSIPYSTFLSFWESGQKRWKSYGNEKNMLLHIFSDPQKKYFDFSKEYYEKEIPMKLINKIFSSESMKSDVILKLIGKLI